MSSTHTGTIQVTTGEDNKTLVVPPSVLQYDAYEEAFSSILYFANDTGVASQELEKKIIRYVDHFVYEEGKTSFAAYGKIQALLDSGMLIGIYDLSIRMGQSLA